MKPNKSNKQDSKQSKEPDHLRMLSDRLKKEMASLSIEELFERAVKFDREKNFESAGELFRAIAWSEEKGYSEKAMYNLGCYLLYGKGCKANTDEALHFLRQAALRGHVEAQYKLGMCYKIGERVGQDQNRALEYFVMAEKQGHPGAQYQLGLYYEAILDLKTAKEYYDKAIKQKYYDAYAGLGSCYQTGSEALPQDLPRAVACYKTAVGFKSSEGKYKLGLCLAQGTGIAKDSEAAFKLIAEAANENHPKAQYAFAMHLMQKGPDHLKEALKWFEASAQKSIIESQYYAGVFYANGVGCDTVDDEKAVAYLEQAARNGHAGAQQLLKQVAELELLPPLVELPVPGQTQQDEQDTKSLPVRAPEPLAQDYEAAGGKPMLLAARAAAAHHNHIPAASSSAALPPPYKPNKPRKPGGNNK